MVKKRQRRAAEPGEFNDPLSNYDPPAYEDDFERFLIESEIGELELRPCIEVSPETTVQNVIAQIAEKNMFCALVVEDGRLLGIFSERDIVNRIGENYPGQRDRPIRELMSLTPTVVYATDSPAKVLNLMAVGGFRHLPVLDMDDRVLGLIGPRRVVKALEEQFC